MTTTAVPDRGPVSVFSSMMGVGRLLSLCNVSLGSSLQYHPYIGPATITEVSSEGTQASATKMTITANKMTPKTFTTTVDVSEIDLELPGFKDALTEAVIKSLTNAVEQEIAKVVHAAGGSTVRANAAAAMATLIGSWIALGDHIDPMDGVILVARDQAGAFLNDFPVSGRNGNIYNLGGLPVWYGTGVTSEEGVIASRSYIHVVFYGEPKVVYNPYGNPLLHRATGVANVGIAVVADCAKAFREAAS